VRKPTESRTRTILKFRNLGSIAPIPLRLRSIPGIDRFFHSFACSFVLLYTATRLVAAPPEPVQKPVKLLGFGEEVDREFSKLTDIGITPFLAYYGVYQGNPVGGVQEQRSAYSC